MRRCNVERTVQARKKNPRSERQSRQISEELTIPNPKSWIIFPAAEIGGYARTSPPRCPSSKTACPPHPPPPRAGGGVLRLFGLQGAQPRDWDGRSSAPHQRGPPAEPPVRARAPPAP